ncbi:MAG: response regulator [Euryarchaeota archaeon]|nr:response regulator [Euryarchaeota archaeon]MBU4340496.1 response regulator [Euryarchaeota archaeon]MBU4453798.1 response regulator [Euryarchaeota archaeon]MCG2737926.1 response regulator [Candidatus Methanoperedenaceae archaeon]
MTKILVVDDEPSSIELMVGLLPKEYEVETACNGKEALIKVKETFPDLILLDIVMPEINGYEVCGQLKSDEKTMCIPVVMVTSLMEKEDRIKAIEAGADDFISKPADQFELNARVKSLLRIKQYHDELVEEQESLRVFNEHLEEKVKERTASLAAEVEMRKKAEENLRMTLKELARSKAELEHIVYIVSRDMQQPLNVVYSNLGLLAQRYKGKIPQKDLSELVGNSVDTAVGMKRLLNDLFAYSRMVTREEPVDMAAILDNLIAEFSAVIEKTGAEITHGKLPVVQGDKTQLSHLFHHLLDNAVKFRSAKPPEVHISAREEGEDWIFSVKDNGAGIDPKFHDSLFMISESEAESKTGIGLAICKKIVERHRGKIWVESEIGKGTTFHFMIPKK